MQKFFCKTFWKKNKIWPLQNFFHVSLCNGNCIGNEWSLRPRKVQFVCNEWMTGNIYPTLCADLTQNKITTVK